jgi:hypothetical protein
MVNQDMVAFSYIFSSFSSAITNRLEMFSQETKLMKRFVSVNRRKRSLIIGYRSIFYLFYIDHKTQKLAVHCSQIISGNSQCVQDREPNELAMSFLMKSNKGCAKYKKINNESVIDKFVAFREHCVRWGGGGEAGPLPRFHHMVCPIVK